MKTNLVFLIGGIVTGIALCLTTAMLIPLDTGCDDLMDHEDFMTPRR